MRKFLILGLIVSVVGVSQAVTAQTTATTPAQASVNIASLPDYMFTTVGDVNVPQEVLFRIQTVYLGHAVNQASKTTHNGQPAYRLRVDRDDGINDYESFYLLYDKNWQFIREEKIAPPPPPPAPEPAPAQPEPEQPSEDDDKPEETETITGPTNDKPKPDDNEEPRRERRGRDGGN